jgi:hypothetical protein
MGTTSTITVEDREHLRTLDFYHLPAVLCVTRDSSQTVERVGKLLNLHEEAKPGDHGAHACAQIDVVQID